MRVDGGLFGADPRKGRDRSKWHDWSYPWGDKPAWRDRSPRPPFTGRSHVWRALHSRTHDAIVWVHRRRASRRAR